MATENISMTAKNTLPITTECLCSMCKCGSHNCPQQYGVKKSGLQSDTGQTRKLTIKRCHPKKETNRICQAQDLPKSTLYSNTTYKQDFDAKRRSDRSPTKPSDDNLKCSNAPMDKGSTYTRDFVPWKHVEQNSCQLDQKKSLKCNSQLGSLKLDPSVLSSLNPQALENLRRYYCPPHCMGTKNQVKYENCLIPFKNKFNLGPPKRKENLSVEKPHEPFSKFTNYKLDYVPHKIDPSKRVPEVKERAPPPPTDPSDFDTTHSKDYTWPPEQTPVKSCRSSEEDPRPSLKLGDGGPMVKESSNMLDYTDPNVAERTLVKPPKEKFHPPTCRMETETTTGKSYPRWENVPLQKHSQKLQESHWAPTSDSDSRRLVSTYQEDFDGLCAALCPAKMIENYGNKILEPKYHFIGSSDGHDYYQRNACTSN